MPFMREDAFLVVLVRVPSWRRAHWHVRAVMGRVQAGLVHHGRASRRAVATGEDQTPKKLRSVVRFAFHQIVLANSIQNLHSDYRLTDAIDDDSRNHFGNPISGTTRLARRAAVW